jgi:hypothetical protein
MSTTIRGSVVFALVRAKLKSASHKRQEGEGSRRMATTGKCQNELPRRASEDLDVSRRATLRQSENDESELCRAWRECWPSENNVEPESIPLPLALKHFEEFFGFTYTDRELSEVKRPKGDLFIVPLRLEDFEEFFDFQYTDEKLRSRLQALTNKDRKWMPAQTYTVDAKRPELLRLMCRQSFLGLNLEDTKPVEKTSKLPEGFARASKVSLAGRKMMLRWTMNAMLRPVRKLLKGNSYAGPGERIEITRDDEGSVGIEFSRYVVSESSEDGGCIGPLIIVGLKVCLHIRNCISPRKITHFPR